MSLEEKEKEVLEKELHAFRKEIDADIKKSESFLETNGGDIGREMALTHTKLQEAKMWAGKCL